MDGLPWLVTSIPLASQQIFFNFWFCISANQKYEWIIYHLHNETPIILGGGWTNPSEKYESNWIISQGIGVKIKNTKNIWNHQPVYDGSLPYTQQLLQGNCRISALLRPFGSYIMKMWNITFWKKCPDSITFHTHYIYIYVLYIYECICVYVYTISSF